MLFNKYHAIKLSVLADKMDSLPHGRFCYQQGKKIVCVTKDRNRPEVSYTNNRKYVVTSKKGREYAPLIREYVVCKEQYDKLMAEWNRCYKCPPPRYDMEKVRQERRARLNGEFFRNVKCANSRDEMHTIEFEGLYLRSKNELIAAQAFKELGLEFKYEPILRLSGGRTLSPDFAVYFEELDLCVLVEIYGMTESGDYVSGMAGKIKDYTNASLWPDLDIVHVAVPGKNNFDKETLKRRLIGAVEAAVPDFDMETDMETDREIS